MTCEALLALYWARIVVEPLPNGSTRYIVPGSVVNEQPYSSQLKARVCAARKGIVYRIDWKK